MVGSLRRAKRYLARDPVRGVSGILSFISAILCLVVVYVWFGAQDAPYRAYTVYMFLVIATSCIVGGFAALLPRRRRAEIVVLRAVQCVLVIVAGVIFVLFLSEPGFY